MTQVDLLVGLVNFRVCGSRVGQNKMHFFFVFLFFEKLNRPFISPHISPVFLHANMLASAA